MSLCRWLPNPSSAPGARTLPGACLISLAHQRDRVLSASTLGTPPGALCSVQAHTSSCFRQLLRVVSTPAALQSHFFSSQKPWDAGQAHVAPAKRLLRALQPGAWGLDGKAKWCQIHPAEPGLPLAPVHPSPTVPKPPAPSLPAQPAGSLRRTAWLFLKPPEV